MDGRVTLASSGGVVVCVGVRERETVRDSKHFEEADYWFQSGQTEFHERLLMQK